LWSCLCTTTVLSIANVIVCAEPVVSIPVPPVSVNDCESKSIDWEPPVSPEKSKSLAVTCASTYVLIALALATVSSLPDTEVKSVSTSVILVALPIVKPSKVTVPSKKASLNCKELVPKSISLVVIGTIAPSNNLNCSVEVPDTSIWKPISSLVVSIWILFNGIVRPASPISPITGPSAAVPSCLCPDVALNAANNWLYSLLNKAAVIVSPII